jgi:hypothetical protein
LRLNLTNLLARPYCRGFVRNSSGSRFAFQHPVLHHDSPLNLPYARPKVGRRASDRKVLDEWYAHHASADLAGDVRALSPLRPHPAARAADSAPQPERRVGHATPAIG